MGRRLETGSRFSALAIIAVLVLTISVILAIGVFIYQKNLAGDINNMNAQLVAARSSLEPAFVQELITIDKRIESAKSLLNQHNVVTPVFNFLEKETLQGVRFSSFNYTLDSKNQPNIELNGEAANFNAIALQADVFNTNNAIKNPVFGNLNTDDKGVAKFNFKSTLDSSAFLYKNIIDSSGNQNAKSATSSDDQINITPVSGDSNVPGDLIVP